MLTLEHHCETTNLLTAAFDRQPLGFAARF